MKCRKGFTFARGVVSNESWESLAKRDLAVWGKAANDPESVANWIEEMKVLMDDVYVDGTFVYFDGYAIPTDVPGIKIRGQHANHDLDFVPQVKALSDPHVIESLLENSGYWTEREHKD